MKESFSSYHPIINFLYFLSVILFSMFFMHPVFLGISVFGAMVYSIYLKGAKAVKFNLLYMIPTLIFIAIINPILNHQGATILLYINDKPITLEAIIYGVASGAMITAVITWFSCYNKIMTSDKFIYLFGRVIPSISLIFSMVLRFVPKFKEQIKKISNGQKALGRDYTNGNIFERARNGVKIISILITWALENGVDTADSMKARGYGLRGRTSFSLYNFDRRDRSALIMMLCLIGSVFIGAAIGENTITYFPVIMIKGISPVSILVYIAYSLLCIFPILVDVVEEARWRLLK